jgi:hypothetical protein
MLQLVILFEIAAYWALNIILIGSILRMLKIFACMIYVIFFVKIVLLACKIPEEMKKIIASAKQLYGDILFRDVSGRDAVLCARLQLIISKKPVRLSIGGILNIRKSLILASFGSLVTYGVIFIQLEK